MLCRFHLGSDVVRAHLIVGCRSSPGEILGIADTDELGEDSDTDFVTALSAPVGRPSFLTVSSHYYNRFEMTVAIFRGRICRHARCRQGLGEPRCNGPKCLLRLYS